MRLARPWVVTWGLWHRKTRASNPKRAPSKGHVLKITAAGICPCIYCSTLSRFALAPLMAKTKPPRAPQMLGGPLKPTSTPTRPLLANRGPPHHPFQLLSKDLPMHLLQHLEPFSFGMPNGQDQGSLGSPNVRRVTQTHKHTTPITFGQPALVAPPTPMLPAGVCSPTPTETTLNAG